MNTTTTLTDKQISDLDAIARACQDRHLTPAQRHELHALMATVIDAPAPTCCQH